MVKKIYIASDHAGLELKKVLIGRIAKIGIDVEDMGPFTYDSVDYPDYAHKVSNEVSKNENTMGVLLCGTGNGVAMTSKSYEDSIDILDYFIHTPFEGGRHEIRINKINKQ